MLIPSGTGTLEDMVFLTLQTGSGYRVADHEIPPVAQPAFAYNFGMDDDVDYIAEWEATHSQSQVSITSSIPVSQGIHLLQLLLELLTEPT